MGSVVPENSCILGHSFLFLFVVAWSVWFGLGFVETESHVGQASLELLM